MHFWRRRVSVEEQGAQNTTDSFEEGKIAYMIYEYFEPPEQMKLYEVYQICSQKAQRMMTMKISTQDGTKLH